MTGSGARDEPAHVLLGTPLEAQPAAARQPQVELCPDGPMLVRGATEITAADGTVHTVERPVVAVCRCGGSARAPWCDGTHKLLQRRSVGRAGEA